MLPDMLLPSTLEQKESHAELKQNLTTYITLLVKF